MNNRIKDLREDMDLRQVDLAQAVGIDQRTISNYETGKTNPDSEALIKLANFFNVTIDYLVGRTGYTAVGKSDRARIIDRIKKDLDSLK